MHRLMRMMLLALCAVAAHAQQMVVEVIELEHRLVRDVVPILQPVLAPGATITGTSNQLILRTTPANLAEVREVLSAIDTRIRQLRITVTQDVSVVMQAREDALSGHVQAGDFAAGVPDPAPSGGAAIGVETATGGATYRTLRTHSQEESSNLHFVLTMEGQPAFVATGQQVPQPYYESTVTPFGGSVAAGVDYQEVSTGVYVTPRVQGDRVTLEVSPRAERLDPRGSGMIERQGLDTTVSGRLGEWIPLGGASVTSGGADGELLARTRRQGDNNYTVWVRVDEQP